MPCLAIFRVYICWHIFEYIEHYTWQISNYFAFTANSNPSTPLLSSPQRSLFDESKQQQQSYNTEPVTSSSTPNNLMEKAFGPMVDSARRIKRRLKPTMQDNEVLRSSLVFLYAACILCWLILIVFLSTNNEPDTDIMELNTIRDGLFFGLFFVVSCLSIAAVYRLSYIDDDAFFVNNLGFNLT